MAINLSIGINPKKAKSGAGVVKGELDGIKAKAMKTEAVMNGLGKNAGVAMNKAATGAKAFGGALNFAKIAAVGLAAVFAISKILRVAAGYQDLRTSLNAVTGSAQGAADAMQLINDVVGRTPFTVAQLGETFIKLKASGLEPTTEQLMLFSDVASITTDRIGTLQAITDLYARTVSGGLGLEDLNRLADRGVPVFKIFSEKLGLARLEIAAVGRTAEGSAMLLEVLEQGLKEVAGGASDLAGKNLSVAFSNLMDAIRGTIDVVLNFTGVTGGLAAAMQGLSDGIQVFNSMLKDNLVPTMKVAAIVISALAFTQIPALITAVATAASGIGIMGVAMGAFTTAVNLARVATIALGGPIGIIWGLIGAAGAAWLVFRDNTEDASDGMYDAAEASTALNTALGIFYYTAAPKAGQSAIELANDNYKLADSALSAAQATLAQMAALRAASTAASAGMGGMGQFINTTTTPEQMAAAEAAIRSAQSALDEAAASRDRAARAVTGAMSDEMSQTLEINRSLTLEIESTTDAIGGLGAALAVVEVKSPLKEIEKDMVKLGFITESVADSIANSIGQGFMDMVSGTKTVAEAFRSMALSIAKELFDVLVIQRMVAAMKGLMGFSDGAAFSGGNVLANANGNAFSGGNVVPFASGGVVTSPTLFPMASGIGLMGEAGPEAIMPLSRGSDGKLGVKVSGGGDGQSGGVDIDIINVLDPSIVGQYMDTAEGRRKIMNIIGEEQAA